MKLVRVAASVVIAIATAAACGGTHHTAALAAPPPLIPRAVLFGNPERGAPLISPDGTHYAFTAPADGVMNVFVAAVGDLAHPTQVTFDRTRPIGPMSWSTDGRWVLYQQDQAGDENFHLFRVGVDGKDALDLTPFPGARAQLFGTSHVQPGRILVGLNARDPQLFDAFEIELATGTATMKVQNPGYSELVADDDLRVRLAVQMDPDGGQRWFAPAAKGWTEVERAGQVDALTTAVVGFETAGQRYYMVDSRGRDTAALVVVDAATGVHTVVVEDAGADAGDVLVHPTTGVIRAVQFERGRKQWQVLDPSIAPDLTALAKLDEGDVSVLSMTDDDRRWVVGFAGDRRPQRYYLWDRDAQHGTLLYAARPALEGLDLARMTTVTIKARDGLELVSYLSLPVEADPDGDGTPRAPVPMVLLVHGGPWARVSWGFSPLAQLLANRGYAVLQVNFRSSTGFGKAFVNAGDRQWGKAMHDDLLDGVAWAVQAGVTRADQICIMGGSYGGYATLAGLTLTPTTFRCGVDIVGPSNLETLLASLPAYWQPMIATFKIRMGDPSTAEGKALLAAASPINHVGAIARPLLIGQGANDPRVKQAESDQIVRAMQQKGLPVTYALFPDEGHGFRRPENNLAFFAIAEAFLAQHLGGRAQPMSVADFAGSTIQLRAGREGIPGLPAGIGTVGASP